MSNNSWPWTINWEQGSGAVCTEIHTLLVTGADLEARDEQGRTILMLVAEYGNPEAMKMLIQELRSHAKYKNNPEAFEAYLNAKDKDGKTALMKAASSKRGMTFLEKLKWREPEEVTERYVGCIEELTKAGADLEIKDKDGYTALACAAAEELDARVKSLIQQGADVNTKANYGYTLSEITGKPIILTYLKDAAKIRADYLKAHPEMKKTSDKYSYTGKYDLRTFTVPGLQRGRDY